MTFFVGFPNVNKVCLKESQSINLSLHELVSAMLILSQPSLYTCKPRTTEDKSPWCKPSRVCLHVDVIAMISPFSHRDFKSLSLPRWCRSHDLNLLVAKTSKVCLCYVDVVSMIWHFSHQDLKSLSLRWCHSHDFQSFSHQAFKSLPLPCWCDFSLLVTKTSWVCLCHVDVIAMLSVFQSPR